MIGLLAFVVLAVAWAILHTPKFRAQAPPESPAGEVEPAPSQSDQPSEDLPISVSKVAAESLTDLTHWA